MNETKETKFMMLQAKVKREGLPDVCRREGLGVATALRIASHRVYAEDVKGDPPTEDTPAVELAKAVHRLERKADDPDYPERARRQYRENEVKNEKFFSKFKAKQNRKEKSGEAKVSGA